MAAQAAKALRDRTCWQLATECQSETEAQAKWFTTRIKTGAPQALVRGMTETPAPRSRPRTSSRRARVVTLRPIAGPLALGFFGLAAATFVVVGTPARLGRADGGEASRPLHPRVHRAAAIHRVALRIPRPRRRRRDRDGPAERHLGRRRARHPHRQARLDERRARTLPPRRRRGDVGAGFRGPRLEARPRAGARNRRPSVPRHRHLPADGERSLGEHGRRDRASPRRVRDLRGVRGGVRGRAQATGAPARPPRQGRAGGEGHLRTNRSRTSRTSRACVSSSSRGRSVARGERPRSRGRTPPSRC